MAQRFSQITTRKCSSWGWKSCDGWRAARAHQAQQGCAGRAGWDRLRLGADGAAWKSSCRPHRSTGTSHKYRLRRSSPSMLWSWPADPKRPRDWGMEKDSCRNQPRSQEGPKEHIQVEAAGSHGDRREFGVSKFLWEGAKELSLDSNPSVLTAGVQQGGREGRRSFLVSGKPSRKRSRRGGGAASAPRSCLFTGEKNECSMYQVGPHPPRRASHNKSHPWAELLSMTRSR